MQLSVTGHHVEITAPLRSYVEAFTGMRFEPAGMTDDPDIRIATSVMDYIFRRLALDHRPYEERADFARVHDAIVDSLQRFSTGVVLAWLPVKLRADFDSWHAALARAVERPMLASLLWMHPPDSRAALNGSALVAVNPPYLLEQGMRGWLPELCALLGDAHAGSEVITSARG